jgi:flagellar hook-basal body complex protein FliE
MMSTPSAAANAYASLARLTDPQQGLTRGAGEASSGPSFSAMLREAVNSINQTSRAADMQSQAMAAGKANIVDVVTAVSETEVAVDALVAVRDRVIAAYEDIMKMPI